MEPETVPGPARYNPGDLVFSAWPIASIVAKERKGSYCDACYAKCKYRAAHCTVCNYVYYCSPECEANIRSTHLRECQAYAAAKYRFTDLELLVLRLHLALQHDPSLKSMAWRYKEGLDDSTLCLEDIPANESTIMQAFGEMRFASLENRFRKAGVSYVREELRKLYCKVQANHIEISADNHRCIGLGLYVGLTKYQHSCVPSANAVFSGAQLYVRAICPIYEPGSAALAADSQQGARTSAIAGPVDSITVSRIFLMQKTERREVALWRDYSFRCDCVRCSAPDEIISYATHEATLKTFLRLVSDGSMVRARQYYDLLVDSFGKVYGPYSGAVLGLQRIMIRVYFEHEDYGAMKSMCDAFCANWDILHGWQDSDCRVRDWLRWLDFVENPLGRFSGVDYTSVVSFDADLERQPVTELHPYFE